MGIQTLMHQYYGDDFTRHCSSDQTTATPVFYVTLFSVVETIVLGCVHASYIGEGGDETLIRTLSINYSPSSLPAKVKQFNAIMAEPDALRESSDSSRRSVGFTQRGAGIVELLDKQADLIDYYKDQLEGAMRSLHAMNSIVHRVQAPPVPAEP